MTERRRDLPMVEVLQLQQEACERAGSSLYARILGAMVREVVAGGRCAEILAPWSTNAMADATPLRFLAAVHALVLAGQAPSLAPYFPSAGGDDDGDPVPAFLALVEEESDAIASGMHLGVQTNEVGRAAALVGPLHLVARRTGLPLRLLEVGSSGGLLLRLDHYRYEVDGDVRWGPADDAAAPDTVRFTDPWEGTAPPLDPQVTIADRRGCDVAPIDPTTEEGAARLRSFLWPDQRDRRARLDQAIEVARRHPVVVDRASADDWLRDRLTAPTPGVATVVHHSIVLQYLPRPVLDEMRTVLAEAGARATPEAPLHWLRMEPAGVVADVRLRTWTGGEPVEELLGTTAYHGPPVVWDGPER